MKYQKITKQDVYRVLVSTALNFNPIQGCINLKNIAYLLKTSRYQVKKYIDELRKDGYVELKCFNLQFEDETFPPYWGYVLTQKGRNTDYFKQRSKEMDELFEQLRLEER